MNKKSKTARTSNNSNNGLTSNFLDERGEAMLNSSTVANTGAECSPIFRHSGSIYQIGNKSEFEDTREADMVRSSNFSSPMAESRDLVRPLMSPHLEVVKDGLYRPSSAERPPFSPDVSSLRHSASDRRLKHFASTTSPTLPPSHLLTASMSFPLAMTSRSQNVELNLPKRSKLLHNYVERSSMDGFNDNVVNLSNVPNLVAVSNQSGPLDDVEELASQGGTSKVKKEPSYRPQVEAISPTGSGDEMSPNDLIRHSKDEILQKINRLDRLISSVDQRVNKLRRLKEPLEEKSIHRPEEELERPVPAVDLSRLGVAHSIYSENRAKALESHQFMRASGFELSLPLYQKPSDAHVYHDNIKKFAYFKPNLIAHVKKRKLFETKRDLYLCKKYDRLSEAWVQRMDRIENNPKKRAKDAKTREIFEKVFPELRRKREEKERLAKMVKKSDADSTVDPEEVEVRRRTGMAAEPPIMLNALARKKRFLSENGRIHDNFELGQLLPGIKKFYWTKSECDIFRETYVAHPKNFARIASQLQNKSIEDCVYFYYVTKKEEGYKQLVRRHNMSRRKHDKAKKAHKEVKEEKVEEHEEIKDLKFLPSSPVVSISSIFNSYQFKLPQYLLLPSSSQSTTPTTSQPDSPPAAPTCPVKCSSPPSPLQNLGTSSTTYYLGMVKQEPDIKFSPLPLSLPPLTSTLPSFPTSPIVLATSTLSSVLPIPQLPSSEAFHSVVQNILPVSSFSSSTSLLTSTPTSTLTNQILTSTTTSNVMAVTTVSSHQQPTHPGMLPPPLHVGGSIVQGTPVVVSHPNELTTWQQLQLHLFLQQQFHQQQQRPDQAPPPPSQFNPLPLAGQDLKVLVNQLTANQQMQETRGSIIKGTPNHVVREPSTSRASPANNHSSPKRPPSGRSKAPSRNENNPLRPEGGLTPGEDGSRLFEHSRDILIDDYMTAQKMNCQQKNFTSYNEQLPSKKHSSLKRKFGPLPSSEGLVYFSGMEVPKGNVPHPSNETARSLIDNIISQNIVKGIEEDRIPLKSSEAARPMTPSRVGTNFQPPGSHYFPTSCGPLSALQSSMMPLIPPPPFFTSGLPLLQGPFIYPPATPIGSSEKVKTERPNFASPPPTQRSPLPSGILRSTVPANCHNPRNSSEGGKTTPRHSSGTSACTNNIYNFISSTHSMQVQSSSSSLNAAFTQLPPAMISQPSSSSSQMMPVPSSTSPGFHSPASFLQMFPLNQFMSTFPLQMPQQGVIPPSTLSSRHPMPPSSLFMSQLIQNFHQQFSGGGGGAGMLTAVAAAAPKSTSATSGHI